MDSPFCLHKQHLSTALTCLFLKLSMVRIFPRATDKRKSYFQKTKNLPYIHGLPIPLKSCLSYNITLFSKPKNVFRLHIHYLTILGEVILLPFHLQIVDTYHLLCFFWERNVVLGNVKTFDLIQGKLIIFKRQAFSLVWKL
jgi:hypothetical protein